MSGVFDVWDEECSQLFLFHQNVLYIVPEAKNHPKFYIIEGYHDNSGSGAGVVHIKNQHYDLIEELVPNEPYDMIKFANILGNIMSEDCEGNFSNTNGTNTGFVWSFENGKNFIKGGLSKTQWTFYCSHTTEKLTGFVLIQANFLEKKSSRLTKIKK
jgi:hypothetical protein